eukprot:scaffold336_cov250-Pinguiococcus_pyrenoidosus.AAC.13
MEKHIPRHRSLLRRIPVQSTVHAAVLEVHGNPVAPGATSSANPVVRGQFSSSAMMCGNDDVRGRRRLPSVYRLTDVHTHRTPALLRLIDHSHTGLAGRSSPPLRRPRSPHRAPGRWSLRGP